MCVGVYAVYWLVWFTSTVYLVFEVIKTFILYNSSQVLRFKMNGKSVRRPRSPYVCTSEGCECAYKRYMYLILVELYISYTFLFT